MTLLLNGRRALRAQIEARYKFIQPDPNDSTRHAQVGSRQARRAPLREFDSKGNSTLGDRRIGQRFRPIYFHGIRPTPPHKQIIAAMKVANRKTALRFNTESSAPTG